MTTAHADHEHPQYVTRADLEALEGRLINRIAELELRMERRFNEQMRWMVGLLLGLILPIYALMIAALIFLYNAKP